MSFEFLALFIRVVAQLFIYIVIASALLSFFLPPYHPIREVLGRIVDPFLNPIRSLMPRTGMVDFSPLILIFAVEILSRIFISILLSI
ncbi:MAG: YggT family protein [Anaerolineales bacterium]|nr:MAG: YggT family protein [Anaerolineales bacterium]